MPTYDIFHAEVRSALENDQWTITDDPLYLRFGEEPLYIDLGRSKKLNPSQVPGTGQLKTG